MVWFLRDESVGSMKPLRSSRATEGKPGIHA